jgi:hypothetical protein
VRNTLRSEGEHPLGNQDSAAITKKKLEVLLATGVPRAAAVVQSVIETFAE